MEVTIKETMMVSPCEDTPKTSLWISNIDLVFIPFHVSIVLFYKPNGSSNFLDTKILKEALSRVLVSFYPVTGRLGYDENGRLEIVCNGKGVLFIEAETSCDVVDDLSKDFTDASKVPQLVAKFDYSGEVSSYPLLALQVTTFNCGGVSIGVSFHHTLADGTSIFHFINSWADIARGLSPTIPPILDRTLLRARDPPTPRFRHIEFEPSPCLKTASDSESQSIASVFKITPEQVNALKAKLNGTTKCSTYSILTAHIWRCATKARDFSEDQELKLSIPLDGRKRLQPPLPLGYFGNPIFFATPVALAGEIRSESFTDTVTRIDQVLKEMDDEYLRSAIDLIEITTDIKSMRRGPQTMRSPNLCVNSWRWFPTHGSDFGWGSPVFMRPANKVHEGMVYILPRSINSDGSFTLVLSLETTAQMERFGTLLYEF